MHFYVVYVIVFYDILLSGDLSHASSPLTLTTKSNSSSSTGSSSSAEGSEGSVSGSWDTMSEADVSLGRKQQQQQQQQAVVKDKKHSHASHTTIEHTVSHNHFKKHCVW